MLRLKGSDLPGTPSSSALGRSQSSTPSTLDNLLLPFNLENEDDLEVTSQSKSSEGNAQSPVIDIPTADARSKEGTPDREDGPPVSELMATWEIERQKQQNLIAESIGPKRSQDNSDIFRSETSMRWYQSLSQAMRGGPTTAGFMKSSVFPFFEFKWMPIFLLTP